MRKTGRRGFSLIELALVLGISGLMLGFTLQSQQTASTTVCHAATKLQLRDIEGAFQRFARTNERLPMPAARNIGVEAPTYGREASGAAIDTSGGTSWGALPFQALGLAPSYASDCWGNKFSYVVTTALTTNNTSGGYLDFAVTGSITVRKDASTNISTTNAYAVISHGEDGLGAVKGNYAGVGRGWCGGAANLKSMNCLATSTTIANAATNNGKDAGDAYFDDLVLTSGRPLIIVNGACNNAMALGCAAGMAISDNGQSACSTTRTWVCEGANGGTNSVTCSRANAACANCSSTSLTWGIGCSAVFPATAHTATTPSTANTNPSYTAGSTAAATCTDGVFSAPSGSCTAVPPPVVGVCNNAVALSCSAGTAISDNGQSACGTTRTWVCEGTNGGANSGTCSFANAACASCSSTSLGWGGGCTAVFPITSHGATTPAQNNTNGAFTGSATSTCSNGSFSGPSGSCNPVVPVNGSCNNSAPGGACAAGSSSGDNGLTACGTTRTWNCDGAFGGTNAGCNRVNASCDTYAWVTGAWQNDCDGSCGGGTGLEGRAVWCYKNGAYIADQSGCYANIGGPPPYQRACTNSTPCVVNGACGGGDNTCNAGSDYNRSYDSNRTWYCSGANGGTNSGQCRGSVCEPTANSVCADVGLGNWGGFATGAHWGNYCTGGAPRWVSVTACCMPGGVNNQSYNWNGVMIPGCNAPPPSQCTFTAYGHHEGSDEFSTYPAIYKTGDCGSDVTVGMSVQFLFGPGVYDVGQVGTYVGSATFLAGARTGDYSLGRVTPFAGTVGSNPLVLRVNWSVISGNAVITNGDDNIMTFSCSSSC